MMKKVKNIICLVIIALLLNFSFVKAADFETETIPLLSETAQPRSELTNYRYAGDDSGRWLNNCGTNLHNVDAFSDLKLP